MWENIIVRRGLFHPRERGRPPRRHCEERSNKEAIQCLAKELDGFAEFTIGRRFAPTRWLAMTVPVLSLRGDEADEAIQRNSKESDHALVC